ncbi:MAG: hypothetical protein ACTHMI_06275 [Mucilaginibacter sp.]
MKKFILPGIIIACAGQLKAQQQLKALYDSVKTSQNIGKFHSDALDAIYAKPKTSELLAFNNKPGLAVKTGVFKAFPDNMPVAALSGNSKMPVAKLKGNDNMPIAKPGDKDDAITSIKPSAKLPATLFPGPQK